VKQAHVRFPVVEYSCSVKFVEVMHHISRRKRGSFVSKKKKRMELEFVILLYTGECYTVGNEVNFTTTFTYI
jgi:hypothetical protein